MANRIFRRAYWGIGPDVEEIDRLEKILKRKLSPKLRGEILQTFSDYSYAHAASRDGVKPSDFRDHMRALSDSAKETADLLDQPGYHSFEKTYFSALERPKRTLPRTAIRHEAYLAVRHQLMVWDGAWTRKFNGGERLDLNLRAVEPVALAWNLMRVSEAAARIANNLSKIPPGRPDSGARALVAGLVSAFTRARIKIQCRYDGSVKDYVGNFREIAAWMSGIRRSVETEESVLCKYAAAAIAKKTRKSAPTRKK